MCSGAITHVLLLLCVCMHNNIHARNAISVTGQMTPSELAAQITSMVDTVRDHQPVDEISLIRKYMYAMPLHHKQVHRRMEEYKFTDPKHTLTDLAEVAHSVYSSVAAEASVHQTINFQYYQSQERTGMQGSGRPLPTAATRTVAVAARVTQPGRAICPHHPWGNHTLENCRNPPCQQWQRPF